MLGKPTLPRPTKSDLSTCSMVTRRASNTDPWATKSEPGNHWIKTGAHVMIVGPAAKTMAGYPRAADADPTKPYVMWPGTPYEHLMLPVK